MDDFHLLISHNPMKQRSEETGGAPVTEEDKAATEGG